MADSGYGSKRRSGADVGRLVMLFMLPMVLVGVIAAVIFGFGLDEAIDSTSQTTSPSPDQATGEIMETVGSSSQSSAESKNGSDGGGASGTAGGKSVARKHGEYFELPEILVNLSSDGRRTNFMKLVVSAELADAEHIKEIELYMPRIIDTFLVYLRTLRVSDIQGSDGTRRLREELRGRINKILMPIQVLDIVFKDILVQ